MGRESRFDLQPNSWYPTDRRALNALLPFLAPGTPFVEPCAGDGRLANWLTEAGHYCYGLGDIAPRAHWIAKRDARELAPPLRQADALQPPPTIITNPPYSPRALMHELLACWLGRGWPCWLLIDAPWMHTGRAAAWLLHCTDIVAAGRMNMFGGTDGRKDHCWFHFTPVPGAVARFWPLGTSPLMRFKIPVDDAAPVQNRPAGDGPPPASMGMLVSGEAFRPDSRGIARGPDLRGGVGTGLGAPPG